MRYVLKNSEMAECDRRTIEEYGMLSEVLMERASLACVEELIGGHYCLDKVLVVCGSGNNGGDGFAIARLLFLKNIGVSVLFLGKEESCTKETRYQKNICEKYGIKIGRNYEEAEYTCIVDAIFGTGLSRKVEGIYREVIEKINDSKGQVLSVDIPSGVNGDTGEVMGTGVKADTTVTFAFAKRGHLLREGREHTGRLMVCDIGIPTESLSCKEQPAFSYVPEDLTMPVRAAGSNKGSYGKALMISGSKNMAGAAALCAEAAIKAGAGLVRVLTEECNRAIIQTLIPEAVLSTYEKNTASEMAVESLDWASVTAIGPGLGLGSDKELLLYRVLTCCKTPLVIDADGINLLEKHKEILKEYKEPCIITPHLGEMSRLTGKPISEIRKDLCQTAADVAREYGVICVLKDGGTVVSDGKRIYINGSGNHGMSTGGSGDVLTGILTGMLAQHMEPFQASCMAVYLHGLAGDAGAGFHGKISLKAGDILDGLEEVILKYEREEQEG